MRRGERAGRLTVMGAEVATCAMATASAATLYGGFFQDAAHLLPLLIAAGGGAVAGLVAGLRRSVLLALGLAAGGFVAVAIAVPYRTLPTLGVLVDDLGHGWGRMLSVALPADATPQLLVLPLLTCWLATFAAVLAGRWSAAPLAPTSPLLAVFVLALLITAGQQDTRIAATAGFLGSVSVLVLVRAGWTEHPVGGPARVATGRLGVVVPVTAVVVLLGMAGAAVLPALASQRFDPRTVNPPPVRVQATVNPLATVKSQLRTDPPRTLFTVRVGRGGHGLDRIRLAVLDRYDGMTWTADHRFLVAGQMLSQNVSDPLTRPVTVEVVLDRRDGPFLPTVGQPVNVDATEMGGGRIGFDDSSGTMVTDAPAGRRISYRLTSLLAPRDDGLVRVRPTAPDGVPTGPPPDLPAELRALAARITVSASTPYERLQAIEAYLRQLPYSLDVPPGHSYRRLTRLLTGTAVSDQLGYAEQHAAAFGVLARAQGMPVRIVVGYRLPTRAGTFSVTTADAHAWPEVRFPGYGWMSFEPTDPERTGPVVPEDPNPPPVAGQDVPPAGGGPAPLVDPASSRGSDADDAVAITVGLTGFAVLVGLGMTATVAGKLRNRRRRRTAATSAGRVVGAWREALDRLAEQGFTPPPSATATEIAGLAISTVGPRAAPLAMLAPLHDAAIHSAQQPDPETVRWAWVLERQLAEKLVTGRFRRVRRLRALADPRPLSSSLMVRRARRHALEQLGVDQP